MHLIMYSVKVTRIIRLVIPSTPFLHPIKICVIHYEFSWFIRLLVKVQDNWYTLYIWKSNIMDAVSFVFILPVACLTLGTSVIKLTVGNSGGRDEI